MQTVPVRVERLPHAATLDLPAYGSTEAAGCDLLAAVSDPVVLTPGASAIVPTGLKIALPAGFEVQIRPRSGLAAKHAVTVLNTPGTIDSDYRGEIGVVLINHGRADFTVERGMRIAQAVLAPVVRIAWDPVDDLTGTERGASERGAGGFGSTGL